MRGARAPSAAPALVHLTGSPPHLALPPPHLPGLELRREGWFLCFSEAGRKSDHEDLRVPNSRGPCLPVFVTQFTKM